MNYIKLLFALFILGVGLSLSTLAAEADETRPEKMQWWLEGKFGLFIHWGPSSIAGVEISWARQSHPHDHSGRLNRIPDEEYDALYKQFNPVDFDAEAIVVAAKEAGMKYLVFTAKHHDGFSNWPTKLSDYNIANTPFKRDICKELADAVHKHGLKLGWYYSTRDWYHPDYLVGDNALYNDFYHGQLRELLTNYGQVDMLWFDHVAGTWADYRFEELFDMIYELQPNILINNRAAKFIKKPKGWLKNARLKELTKGDFDTPEGRVGVFRKDYPWETCMPMSKGPDGHGGWSYRPDAITASFEKCAQMLAACVTGCGNMLLNIGPMPSGAMRPEELENLKKFKPWIATYGESIYSVEGGPYISGQWGGSCMKDKVLYLHVFEWENGSLKLPALPREVLSCVELGGESVSFEQDEEGLVFTLKEGKARKLHSVLKCTLDKGGAIDLIPVGNASLKKQHGTLVNPMGEKKH